MEVIQRDEPPTKKAKTIHDTGGDGSARPFVASRGNSIPYIDLTQDNIAQREPPVTETQITTNCDAVPTRAFSPDVSNTRVADPATAYDTCFGLLCVQATCSDAAKIPSQCTPVTLGFEGKVIRIYLRESNERVAIILSDALAHLVEKFAVTLTGTICGKKLRSMAIKKVEKLNPMTNIGVAFCSLRIVVYGNLMHGSTVAEILGKNDLFLQHPGKTEFDNSVNYLNPQYLLPPDEGMPPIEKLSVSHCCAGRLQSATSNTFWEDERANIYRVFDTAGAPNGTITTIEPSSRLLSKPKRHQMEALVMMIEKEAGIYDRAQFPTMWKASHTPSEEIRKWD
ncbi:SNF2 family N-terminal domain-containing protein [Penicillium lagena]|uniref:SNF2 family N-terminal domain-containing protein n=1 Tax=Penicillium lagena TaxID=94218 RepID=UPI00254264EB|nr:SNF2 family N-terminal domain-containing protein [Penicillium lagena]KAJ5602045.1 SNF2 family N-terminal domain-containing protein [Penicillium lagena]